jgi:alpha-ketoglutarate-dependent taurine dioxygenase
MAFVQRKSINLSAQRFISSRLLHAGQPLPLLVQPTVDDMSLAEWATGEREWVEEKLSAHGGILFRGFSIKDIADFETAMRNLGSEPLPYEERSSPRSVVKGNIYTSTDYPPHRHIFLHNENSYQNTWPMKLYFFCIAPAQSGGETPLANTRNLLATLPSDLVHQFVHKHILYRRTYRAGVGLSWQIAFQTPDRLAVERQCDLAGIRYQWTEDGLRTWQVRPPMARHPRTGELIWFNHATFFHLSTLETDIQSTLQSGFSRDDLPINTYYGDGSEIEPETLDTLRQAYRDNSSYFPWQSGDVLLLDNMLSAHGRSPYTGARRIVVGMADLHSRESL